MLKSGKFIENNRIKQICKGDKTALKTLYTLYKVKVYNTAIGYLQHAEEAEEITQDVFVTIFKKAIPLKVKLRAALGSIE